MNSRQISSLTDFSFVELENWFVKYGFKKFRAKQLWDWLYIRYVADYNQMTNLPKNVRAFLIDNLPILKTNVQKIHLAADKSEKRLIKLTDGDAIESVWIPMGNHATVCVSTQAGCPIGCKFCASGANGFNRNLSVGEIIEQVWMPAAAHSRRGIKNIVFMGTGEPFLNYNNLINAIKILNDHNGLNIGSRRMTVSTVGILNKIIDFARDVPQANLAVSLHATNDELRKKLIPNCPSKINDLLAALKEYYKITHRKITFEYVLIKDINDSLDFAAELVELIKKIPSKLNLIEYNKVNFNKFDPPNKKTVDSFLKSLINNGIDVTLRRKKGDDINAACGQLRLR